MLQGCATHMPFCAHLKHSNSILRTDPCCKGHANNPEAPTHGVKLASENINVDFIPKKEDILAALWFSGAQLLRKRKSELRFDSHLSYSAEEEQPRWVMIKMCCVGILLVLRFTLLPVTL